MRPAGQAGGSPVDGAPHVLDRPEQGIAPAQPRQGQARGEVEPRRGELDRAVVPEGGIGEVEAFRLFCRSGDTGWECWQHQK